MGGKFNLTIQTLVCIVTNCDVSITGHAKMSKTWALVPKHSSSIADTDLVVSITLKCNGGMMERRKCYRHKTNCSMRLSSAVREAWREARSEPGFKRG